jgi:hypothetical protein
MRGKLTSTIAALSILLVISATCTLSTATTYAPGVSVGTVANYSFGETGVNDASAKTEVTSVNGAIVTFTITYYYSNGTQASSHTGVTENVSSQEGEAWMFYLAANLAINNPIYVGSTLYKINGTLTDYSTAGASRTVNYMNVTFMSGSVQIVEYWDKPTGLMVKFAYHETVTTSRWINFTLTSTSLWGTGASGTIWGIPWLYLAGAGVIVVVLIVAVVLRRRH